MKPEYSIEGDEYSAKLIIDIKKGQSLGFFPRHGIDSLIRRILRGRLKSDIVKSENQIGGIETVKEVAQYNYKITVTIEES